MFDNLFLVPLQYAPQGLALRLTAFFLFAVLLPITAAGRQTAPIRRTKALLPMHRMMYIFAILVYLSGFVNRLRAPYFPPFLHVS